MVAAWARAFLSATAKPLPKRSCFRGIVHPLILKGYPPAQDLERFFPEAELLRRDALPLRAGGTFAPFLRASESPIATACLRLFTFPPRPDFPRRRVPRFRRRIALSTLLPAPLLYFLRLDLRADAFFAAIDPPSRAECVETRTQRTIRKNAM
jgi:hypothetical protein